MNAVTIENPGQHSVKNVFSSALQTLKILVMAPKICVTVPSSIMTSVFMPNML